MEDAAFMVVFQQDLVLQRAWQNPHELVGNMASAAQKHSIRGVRPQQSSEQRNSCSATYPTKASIRFRVVTDVTV